MVTIILAVNFLTRSVYILYYIDSKAVTGVADISTLIDCVFDKCETYVLSFISFCIYPNDIKVMSIHQESAN